eukprot:scaffold6057_cov112-Isochrysis_galbana.AAC.1
MAEAGLTGMRQEGTAELPRLCDPRCRHRYPHPYAHDEPAYASSSIQIVLERCVKREPRTHDGGSWVLLSVRLRQPRPDTGKLKSASVTTTPRRAPCKHQMGCVGPSGRGTRPDPRSGSQGRTSHAPSRRLTVAGLAARRRGSVRGLVRGSPRRGAVSVDGLDTTRHSAPCSSQSCGSALRP